VHLVRSVVEVHGGDDSFALRTFDFTNALFWLAVLYIVVRLTLADSKAVLLAYYASLRLFSCSFFTYIVRSVVAQPNLLARRSRPLMSGLDAGEAAAEFSKAMTEFSIHCLAKARCSD
jgi:hypothetical protein